MSMMPTPQNQLVMAGFTYDRRRDITYRVGLVIQVLGSSLLAILYPLGNPFYTAGIMVFEVGVFLSAFYFCIRMSWIKKAILTSALTGIAAQVYGLYAPEEYAGSIIIAGISIVCIGAAGMAGKEAFCCKYYEGWLLVLGFSVVTLANLLGKENQIFNSVGFSILFLLLLSLAGNKLKEPLLSRCS